MAVLWHRYQRRMPYDGRTHCDFAGVWQFLWGVIAHRAFSVLSFSDWYQHLEVSSYFVSVQALGKDGCHSQNVTASILTQVRREARNSLS